MEPDEVTLSDVHLNPEYEVVRTCTSKEYGVVVSRFPFRSNSEKPERCESVKEDEDGDLVVPRSTDQQYTDLIYIEHTLSTRLVDVGLQVWQGSLLLCDYILDNSDLVRDRVVLELGGGVGLASIVAGITAKTVICTDIGNDVLELCKRNAEMNKELYAHQTDKTKPQNVIQIRELDWTQNLPRCSGSLSHFSDEKHCSWQADDITILDRVEVILAADVIYDNDLTDAFFKTAMKCLTGKHAKVIVVALERRLNFTFEDLDISCPAYNHFKKRLTDLCQDHAVGKAGLACQQIDTTFPQYFQYTRTKYLELWKITSDMDQERKVKPFDSLK